MRSRRHILVSVAATSAIIWTKRSDWFVIRLFGTDGVRGLAGRDLTAGLTLELAIAAAEVLPERGIPGKRPRAVIGRDPRASGEFLEAAVVAGLASAGVDVIRLGVLPTPAVAVSELDATSDVSPPVTIRLRTTASNSSRGGHKLSNEGRRDRTAAGPCRGGATGRRRRVNDDTDSVERYITHLVNSCPTADGLKAL